MDCEEFRKGCAKYIIDAYVPRYDEENYSSWVEHMATCKECSDLSMKTRLEKDGLVLADFPCVHIAYHSLHKCDVHTSPWDCPDTTLVISEEHYGIPIRDGGESYIRIDYCPWCGVSLYEKDKK